MAKKRQDFADELTCEIMAEVFGELFTECDDITEDKVMSSTWEMLNEQVYNLLGLFYEDEKKLELGEIL